MLALIPILMLAATQTARTMTRAEFRKALLSIEHGGTRAQVKAVLGLPDDIIEGQEGNPNRWLYGVASKGRLPTLGQVIIYEEGSNFIVGRYHSPLDASMPDRELTARLQKLPDLNLIPWPRKPDALELLQRANEIISAGDQKARAIVYDYAALTYMAQDWNFWLVFAVFEPAKSGISFPFHGNRGLYSDPKAWPTCPVMVVDDLPILDPVQFEIGGPKQSFESYFEENQSLFKVRSHLYRPLDGSLSQHQEGDTRRAVRELAVRDYAGLAALANRDRDGVLTHENSLPSEGV